MNQYDARQTFINYLEQYIAGIETEERLSRACDLVSAYRDPMTGEGSDLVKAILGDRRSFHGSYAGGGCASARPLRRTVSVATPCAAEAHRFCRNRVGRDT
jgi:hypothetical protein